MVGLNQIYYFAIALVSWGFKVHKNVRQEARRDETWLAKARRAGRIEK